MTTGRIQQRVDELLAKISATKPEENDGMLDLSITLEYPATAPAGKRRTLDFHSRIP